MRTYTRDEAGKVTYDFTGANVVGAGQSNEIRYYKFGESGVSVSDKTAYDSNEKDVVLIYTKEGGTPGAIKIDNNGLYATYPKGLSMKYTPSVPGTLTVRAKKDKDNETTMKLVGNNGNEESTTVTKNDFVTGEITCAADETITISFSAGSNGTSAMAATVDKITFTPTATTPETTSVTYGFDNIALAEALEKNLSVNYIEAGTQKNATKALNNLITGTEVQGKVAAKFAINFTGVPTTVTINDVNLVDPVTAAE